MAHCWGKKRLKVTAKVSRYSVWVPSYKRMRTASTTKSVCHRGVVIYVKKYLNMKSFCINQNRFIEYSCKIVLKDNSIKRQ